MAELAGREAELALEVDAAEPDDVLTTAVEPAELVVVTLPDVDEPAEVEAALDADALRHAVLDDCCTWKGALEAVLPDASLMLKMKLWPAG